MAWHKAAWATIFLGCAAQAGTGPRSGAAEPPEMHPQPLGDGLWRAEVTVPASLADVHASLENPLEAAKFSPDISSIRYLSHGPCDTLHAETSGVTGVAYDYQRCATADGWHETMVSSSMLAAYEVRWRLTAVAEGTHIAYDIQIKPKFPAPDFLFAPHMRDSMRTILD
jgi:hypothetical protein